MTTDPKDAEIARLREELEKLRSDESYDTYRVRSLRERAEKAEAERDAALAQVAGAYEAAALAASGEERVWEAMQAIRALTPADALAARDRRDAQMRAAGMVTLGDTVTRTQARILAAAEKEAGNG